MSRLPIVSEKKLYEGPWLFKKVDYVVYPSGIMFDRLNDSFIWVSMGHQDRDAYLLKFEVDTLLRSLEFVSGCNGDCHT